MSLLLYYSHYIIVIVNYVVVSNQTVLPRLPTWTSSVLHLLELWTVTTREICVAVATARKSSPFRASLTQLLGQEFGKQSTCLYALPMDAEMRVLCLFYRLTIILIYSNLIWYTFCRRGFFTKQHQKSWQNWDGSCWKWKTIETGVHPLWSYNLW